MYKIVYLILSHKNPDQVYRLISTLKRGSNNSFVVVNHDSSKSDLNFKELPDIPNIKIIKSSTPSGWGDYSLVDRVLNSMNWICSHLRFCWLIFLSGQDYPIKPIVEIEKFLDNTSFDAFIRGISLSSKVACGMNECSKSEKSKMRCKDCEQRYYFQYIDMPNFNILPKLILPIINKFERYIHRSNYFSIRTLPLQNGYSKKIGVRSKRLFGSPEFTCHKGSQWFSLNYDCVKYIMEFIEQNKRFVAYYKRTIIPDESFFQTILFNNQKLNICNDNYRYISWKSSRVKSPEIIGINDLKKLKKSKEHFARKFDSKLDRKILDMIDRKILKMTADINLKKA